MTHPNSCAVWHDAFLRVTWRIPTCDMTHSYVWHVILVCVTWRIHTWHDAMTQCNSRAVCHVHMCGITHTQCVTDWLVHLCDMTYSRVTWLVHMCAMTHSHVWRDTSTRASPRFHNMIPQNMFYLYEHVMPRMWMRHVVTWCIHMCNMTYSN